MSSSRSRRTASSSIPAKMALSKPPKKVEDALPTVAQIELDPTITKKLGRTLRLYIKLILFSIIQERGYKTEDIVDYLNKTDRLQAVGSPLTEKYAVTLVKSATRGSDPDQTQYNYIWARKCSPDYQCAIAERILLHNTRGIDLPDGEDKLVDFWLKEKNIVKRDLGAYIQFVLYATQRKPLVPPITMEQITAYFFDSLQPLTENRAAILCNRVFKDSDLQRRYNHVWEQMCSKEYRKELVKSIRGGKYEFLDGERLATRWTTNDVLVPYTPYINFVLYSMKEMSGIPKISTREIVIYLNNSARLSKVGSPLTQGHAQYLYDMVMKRPSQARRYRYIFTRKCSSAYREKIEKGIRENIIEDLGDEDSKDVEDWVNDEKIMKNDEEAEEEAESTSEEQSKEDSEAEA